MKDKDSAFIFEKYEAVYIEDLQSKHAIDAAKSTAVKTGLAIGAKRLSPKIIGGLKASPASLPLAVGEFGAGSMERYHYDQAVRKGQISQADAEAELKGSKKPKGRNKSPNKLIKGSANPITEQSVMSQEQIMANAVIVDKLAAYGASGMEQFQWVLRNIPEMESHQLMVQFQQQLVAQQAAQQQQQQQQM